LIHWEQTESVLLTARLRPDTNTAVIGEDSVVDYRKMLAAKTAGISIEVITLVAAEDAPLGQTLLLYPDGVVDGILVDDEITRQVVEQVRRTVWERPALFELPSDARYRFFRDKFVNSWNAVVFGGGHISQPLVQMLTMLDFAVTVVDDRPEFANRARFPGAKNVICEQFARALQKDQVSINDCTAVIIVTRGHRYDLDCLRGTIGLDSGYLGMIGSRYRVRGILELLRQEGYSEANLRKLHAPIGIDIGGVTPAEIALSIVAEVVGVLRSGSLNHLSLQEEKIRHG